MGYTTKFNGRFDIAPKLALDTYQALVLLAGKRHEGGGFPGYYCQWIPTKDGLHIEWDGNEAFYHYVEWLHYIVDHILIPGEYIMSGSVQWQGDEVGDAGTISVVNNQITAMEGGAQVTGSEEQLAEFKSIADKFRGLNAEKIDEIDRLKKQLAAAQREAESNDRQSTMLAEKLRECEAKLSVAQKGREHSLRELAAANAEISRLAGNEKTFQLREKEHFEKLGAATVLHDQDQKIIFDQANRLYTSNEQLAAIQKTHVNVNDDGLRVAAVNAINELSETQKQLGAAKARIVQLQEQNWSKPDCEFCNAKNTMRRVRELWASYRERTRVVGKRSFTYPIITEMDGLLREDKEGE